jgi:hypothetical protein
MLYYAYLPVLLDSLPDELDRDRDRRSTSIPAPLKALSCLPNVYDRLQDVPGGATSADRYRVKCTRSDELSNAGFAFGYFSGVVGLFIAVPFVLLLTSTQSSLETATDTTGYRVMRPLTGLPEP